MFKLGCIKFLQVIIIWSIAFVDFIGPVEKSYKRIKTRKMKNFDKEAFFADVSGICWEQKFSETDDINALGDNWSSLFSLIIDKHAPIS